MSELEERVYSAKCIELHRHSHINDMVIEKLLAVLCKSGQPGALT